MDQELFTVACFDFNIADRSIPFECNGFLVERRSSTRLVVLRVMTGVRRWRRDWLWRRGQERTEAVVVVGVVDGGHDAQGLLWEGCVTGVYLETSEGVQDWRYSTGQLTTSYHIMSTAPNPWPQAQRGTFPPLSRYSAYSCSLHSSLGHPGYSGHTRKDDTVMQKREQGAWDGVD